MKRFGEVTELDRNFPAAQLEGYKRLLRMLLGDKRLAHSYNVADSARELAEQYGADPDWAYLAGLLHDICKEMPVEKQVEFAETAVPPPDEFEWNCPPVIHGIAAESYLRIELGIENRDVLNAVRFHTVGRAGMSLLEEIVYMADLISADRDYSDVGHFRKLAHTDLKKAMFEAMEYSLKKSENRNRNVMPKTKAAYDHYLEIIKQREK